MSIYTTSFQKMLCLEKYDENKTIFDKIEMLRQNIFPYDYTTPLTVDKNDFKTYFETMFITHFFTEEIAFETEELFILKLYSKMLEVMPSYSKKLDVFYSVNNDSFFNKSHTKTENKSDTVINSGERKTTNKNGQRKTTTNNGQRESENNNFDVSADLPINLITSDNIDNVNYATAGKKQRNTSKTSATEDTVIVDAVDDASITNATVDSTHNNGSNDSITISGSVFNYLNTYNTEIKSIMTELLNEFNNLFLCIW